MELETLKFMRLKGDGIKDQHEINSEAMSPTNNPNQTKPSQFLSITQLNFFFTKCLEIFEIKRKI